MLLYSSYRSFRIVVFEPCGVLFARYSVMIYSPLLKVMYIITYIQVKI